MIEQLNKWVRVYSLDPIHTTKASYMYSTEKGISGEKNQKHKQIYLVAKSVPKKMTNKKWVSIGNCIIFILQGNKVA